MVKRVLAIIMILVSAKCMAATHYVVPTNSAAADPYTNWITAGTNIIDVVNAAVTNTAPRVVLVTNGTYWMTNTISVSSGKTLTLQSVNGRDVTIINGNKEFYTNNCMSIAADSSIIDGFTITNYIATNVNGIVDLVGIINIKNCLITGNKSTCPSWPYGHGGGMRVNGTGSTVSNCIIRGNYAFNQGGGIYISKSSVSIVDCEISFNIADSASGLGGGIMADAGGSSVISNLVVKNCRIFNNVAPCGGGIWMNIGTNKVIDSCIITGNTAKAVGVYGGLGGGIFTFGGVMISNCVVSANIATNSGGGIWGAGTGTAPTNQVILRNCLIAMNRAVTNIGGGAYLSNGILESCTVVTNYAGVSGGGLYIKTPGAGTNNIIYFNTAPSAANFTNTVGNTGLNFSCVFPAVDGTGNIASDPRLVDLAGGNYRLRMGSPCVNTGTNQDWMTNAVDLDGNARILNIIVDMGAYETILWQGTIYSFP